KKAPSLFLLFPSHPGKNDRALPRILSFVYTSLFLSLSPSPSLPISLYLSLSPSPPLSPLCWTDLFRTLTRHGLCSRSRPVLLLLCFIYFPVCVLLTLLYTC